MSFAMLEEDAVTKRPVSMRTPIINVHACSQRLIVSSFNGAYLHCEPLHLVTHAGSQCTDVHILPTATLHYCHPVHHSVESGKNSCVM